MPEGQFSGPRARYLYTDDNGVDHVIVMDVSLGGLQGTGLTAAPDTTTASKIIQGIDKRYVLWVGGTTKKRKKITCNASGSLYLSNSTSTLTVDGEAGKTTGRIGEKCRF